MRQVVAAIATLLALPATAAAAEQTFCVQAPGCSGTEQPTVPAALSAAMANPGPDHVRIGPGTFNATGATLSYLTAGNPVNISGAGQGQTTLTRTVASGATVINLSGGGVVLRDLTVRIPAGTGNRGVSMEDGVLAERIRVTADPGAVQATGVSLFFATLRDSGIDLGTTTPPDHRAFQALPSSLIENVVATAARGGNLSGGSTLSGLRLTASSLGLTFDNYFADDASTLERSQIRLTGDAVASDLGVLVTSRPDDARRLSLNMRGVTVAGRGGGVGVKTAANGTGPDTRAATDLRDTVVRGFSRDLEASAGPTSGTASVGVDHSAYDFSKRTSDNPAATYVLGASNVDLNGVDPRVTDVGGDLRPWGGSPLIDRGVPGGLLGSESTLDLGGLPRLVDGDGDGVARRDIGAFEYQRTAPAITASASPTAAAAGQPIAFTASASDSDPGDSAAISWTFDDGTTAQGASVQHAFATPGTHTATAVATDPSGATGSAQVPVNVSAVSLPDALAPRLGIGKRGVRMSSKGVVSVSLTCPADEASGPCGGTLTLTTDRAVRPKAAGRSRARRVRLGSKRFSIRSGRTQKVNVKLSRRNRRLVVRLKSLRVRANARVRDAAGNAGTADGRFKLSAPRRRR